MKFTKFIPVAMAVALAVTPTFAADTDTVSSEFTLTNPAYFNITELPGAVKTAAGVIAEDASTGVISLSYTTPMAVTYRVVNNQKNHNVYVHANAVGANTCEALGGANVSNLKLVFANTATKPTDAAILDAAASASTKANNANAIAFPFQLGAVTETEGSIADPTYASNILTYIAQPGTFEIPYTLGTAPSDNTFSSIDQEGTYKSTLIITDVAP